MRTMLLGLVVVDESPLRLLARGLPASGGLLLLALWPAPTGGSAPVPFAAAAEARAAAVAAAAWVCCE